MGAISTSYEPSGSQTRPWLRWAARIFDFFLFSTLMGILIGFMGLIYPSALNIPDGALEYLLMFAYVFVEPIMLCSWGTTPGKALFKIRLRRQNGKKLYYSQALSRSFSVWVRGLGLGIPLVSLFTLLNSYNSLTKEGITSWDRGGNFSVSHQVLGPLRTIVIGLIFFLFLLLIVVGNQL